MSTPAAARSRTRIAVAGVDLVVVAAIGAVVASVAAWAVSLAGIDVLQMNDLGLVSVLPPLFLGSVALVTLSYAVVASTRPDRTWLLIAHILALIVMLFAVTAIVEPAPRFSVSWRHAGIIEVLTRTGQIDPSIDAYFSWPGFFALGALLTKALGLSSALELTPWAPLAFNLMYLPAVLMIFEAITTNRRIVWVGAWIFFIGNWIGQDYFSPQGLDYFLYLLVLGLLLTWFKSVPPVDGRIGSWFQPVDEPASPVLRASQRAALMAIVVLLFGSTVYSHQLTPFALLGIATTLVIVRRLSTTGLPILMGVVLGTWLSYMTVNYLSGHISQLIARIGNVDTTVTANLVDRIRGSSLHLVVLAVRLGTTAGLFLLAFLGTLRRIFGGRRDLTWPILTIAPFGLLLLQDYGGEMLLRVYLFSLPFAAFLAASAVVEWRAMGGPMRRAIPVAALTLVLLATFFVNRYGNERMDLATADEASGMNHLYQIAPKDSLLVAIADNAFWKDRDYELYHYAIVTEAVVNDDVPAILSRARRDPLRRSFIILSRAQRAQLELQYGVNDAAWTHFEATLRANPTVQLVYSNPDIEIFEAFGRSPA